MKSAKKRIVHTLTAAATCAAMVSPAAAFDLTGGYYMTYGDANSYSLPINGLEVMAGPGQIDLYTKLGLQSQLGNPIAGIWTAIVAGFLISALGGSRVQIGGPTGA